MTITLMYVSSVTEGGVELSSYSNEGVFIPINVPDDVLRSLRGRQCWVKGEWGDKCDIDRWLPLPTISGSYAEPTP